MNLIKKAVHCVHFSSFPHCQHQSCLFRLAPSLFFQPNHSAKWVARVRKRQEREDTVFQYAGKNTKRASRVYVWGHAGTGALGVRRFLKPDKRQHPRREQQIPQRLDFWDDNHLKVHEVGCGYGFSVYLCSDQKQHLVYSTGINTDSQLGYQEYPKNSGRILDYVIEPSPTELPLLYPDSTKLLHVSCGRAHTVMVTDKEGIFSLGNNSHGQCGRQIVEDEIHRGSKTINRVNLDGDIMQVECGQDHTLFLKQDGTVFSCGLGSDGQTGLGHYTAVGTPTRITGELDGENIKHISSKVDCTLAVSEKGDLYGWGNSEYNQLSSVESNLTQVATPRRLPFNHVGKVVKAAAAGSMCALLNNEGHVFVWGFGILGKGPNLEESHWPTQIPPTLFGQNEFSPDTKVVDIKCGINHFAALTSGGQLYMWGRNNTGVLGLGHINDQFFPYQVHVPAEVIRIGCGVDHTVVLTKAFV